MATFEEQYRQHAQTVFRFALRVAGKREVAEDLKSEAFLALYRNLDSIEQSQLPGWRLTDWARRLRKTAASWHTLCVSRVNEGDW